MVPGSRSLRTSVQQRWTWMKWVSKAGHDKQYYMEYGKCYKHPENIRNIKYWLSTDFHESLCSKTKRQFIDKVDKIRFLNWSFYVFLFFEHFQVSFGPWRQHWHPCVLWCFSSSFLIRIRKSSNRKRVGWIRSCQVFYFEYSF